MNGGPAETRCVAAAAAQRASGNEKGRPEGRPAEIGAMGLEAKDRTQTDFTLIQWR